MNKLYGQVKDESLLMREKFALLSEKKSNLVKDQEN